MKNPKNFQNGYGMVEILVCAGLIVLIGASIVVSWSQFLKMTVRSSDLTKAALLTEEAGEALLLWRDDSYTTKIKPLTLNVPYYLTWNGTAYATSSTPTLFQNNYVVKFTMSSVSRDGSSEIVTSGGTVDTDTLKATIVVIASSSASTTISTSELLIHNVYSN